MMRFNLLILLPLFSTLTPAYAADEIAGNNEEQQWVIGVSSGISMIEGSSDQQFSSLSLNKEFGDSYVGISVTYIDSGQIPGLITSVPASTTELSLSAGTSFDAISVDAYLSFGKRDFDAETIRNNGQPANISSSGNIFGFGGAINYDIPLGEHLFLTPTIAGDYNQLDVVRIIQDQNGRSTGLENAEKGVTGTFGLALQQIFGPDDNHVASLTGNIVTTSNTTSFNPGTNQSAILRVLAPRDQPGQKDSWGEMGVAFSFALSKNLRLDLSALQTIGFLNSDATSLSTGLRYSF